ncbi:type IX secretion system periplasmic lipoprotein PorW/SprE [Pedobacter arcticus]
MKISHKYLYLLTLSAVCIFAWSCKAKKDKPKVKFMKNLTAHYNIYFNAKEALEESKNTIRNAQEEDFSQLLEIFPLPNPDVSANETEKLDEVIKRANLIAIEKYESNWLDDSYLLLADAEYLKGDYYNAIEYYSYVGQTFTKEKKNKLKAYLGQVKSDFALDLIPEADSVLDMAIALKYKYQRDQVAVTQAKLAIIKNDVKGAINHLKNAVGDTKNTYDKTRWRYILAQLQEIDGDTESATANYDKIAKSNTSFEMAFNANLSKIRISESADGKDFDKIATLKKLLKEDKNRQLKDQIYYQIGKAYEEKKEYSIATDFYVTAAHTVPGTAKQKGLTYLKLAELNFETLKNYTKSQLYYDSTLQFLPKNYPNYTSIATKANNLKYLAERLTIIDNQKNSLYLATLSEDQITARVDSIFAENEKSHIKTTQSNTAEQLVSINDYSSANKKAGTFYFYNDAAMGQGFSEFKRRWGNRTLTDNWRVSAENMLASADNGQNPNEDNSDGSSSVGENRDSIRAKMVRTIPYTLQAKQSANEKISTALYEIALFYKDILKDEAEATEAFQAVIQNFPEDKNLANIYYQLYRLSAETNPAQSAIFKQKILTQYPNSVYAKAIAEPNFGKEREFGLNALKDEYAGVYQLYTAKKYREVLTKLNTLKPRYSTFKEIEPTFAYLEALTIGHTQKTPVFLASLNQIVKSYPDNNEVVPIAKHQIDFITRNRTVFDQRPTALLSHDDNEYNNQQPQLVFAPAIKEEPVEAKIIKPEIIKESLKKPEPKPIVVPKPELAKVEKEVIVEKPAIKTEELPAPSPEISKTVEVLKPAIVEKTPEPAPIAPKTLAFSTNERQRHLIIIDISDPKQNIAQPFSKLSRYFYSKFDPSEVKLVIRIVGGTEKFVIISGNFYTKEQVDIVSDELAKNLPEIMEGQTTQYRQFVVSEENLMLLTDKKSIDQYLKAITPNK